VRRAFRTIVWPRRRLLALGLFLLSVNRLCGLVLPGATKYLIDDVVGKRNADLLTTVLVVVGAAVAVQAVTSFLLTRLLSVEAQHLIAELRARVQRHVIHLPVRYFESTKSGVMVSRIMSDVEGVRNLVGTGLVQLVGGVLTAAVALVILLRIDTTMTAVALVPLVLFALISMKAFRYIRPIFRKRSAIRAEVTGRLTEAIGGIRVIKGFHAEEREKQVFRDGVLRLFANVKKTLTTTSFVTSAATLLLGITSVAIMGLGGRRILGGELTVGEFFAFTLYLGFLVSPIVQMSRIGTQITEAFAGLDRMDELLSEPREGGGRTHRLERVEGEIVFERVGFAYDEGTEVLHDIDLRAAPGTVTALVGSSGSGKSTLAGLAASFLTPTRGVVKVDGVDLASVELGSYRRHLGVVLQDDFLFEGTIRENIRFGAPDAGDAELAAAVEAAHVREFTDPLPDGLDTMIGERGIKLSGGQRQRVSIARALLADPRVLILDEATSNLDAESESYIQASLGALMRGRTTFVIAHRLSTIRQADQIVVLEDGRIVERGDHDALIEARGRYHELFTYQARI
jgi:subfamily B ATP-binding cassette protein MsbA